MRIIAKICMVVVLSGGIWCVTGHLSSPALAANPTEVQTVPSARTTLNGNASGTVTVSNTFQKIFDGYVPGSDRVRAGCLVMNLGTHNMWVNEATITPTETNTVLLPPVPTTGMPAIYHCDQPGGTVLRGEIDITGTAGDAFYAAQW